MKKVAIFTTFYEAESGFSVVTVAKNQVRMLLNHGYDPIVLVQTNFKQPEDPSSVWSSTKIDLRPVLPNLHLSPEVGEDFDERVERILRALRENLAGVDVCITHDVVLLDYYKEHNIAARLYAKEDPDLLWLHWLHSQPTGSAQSVPSCDWVKPRFCRQSPPPGYLVYPNDTDRNLVARAYGVGMERVKPCRAAHAQDPLLVGHYDALTKTLAERADLLNGEVVAVYPARLNRSKQVEKAIRLMAGVQAAGYETRLLVLDWQSQGEEFIKYADELVDLADEVGLGSRFNLSSRLDRRCAQGVPSRVAVELIDLGTVYIHPSGIETYSLVVHEAMLRGKLCVLNFDLPVMRELYGDAAIYMDFGSGRTPRSYTPSEQAFWNDEAKRLIAELKQNRALMAQARARREWSPAAQWREFETLLYLS